MISQKSIEIHTEATTPMIYGSLNLKMDIINNPGNKGKSTNPKLKGPASFPNINKTSKSINTNNIDILPKIP